MTDVVQVAKRLIPVEQIVLVEAFVPPTEPTLRSTREFKSRIVQLDRSSILSELPPEHFAEQNGFRTLALDRVATNPAIAFRVEAFAPTEHFQPSKPYLTRLVWLDEGHAHSKLLLTPPEEVLAIVLRGEEAAVTPVVRPVARRRRSIAGPRRTGLAKELG